MLKSNIRLNHVANTKVDKNIAYPNALKSLFNNTEAEQAYQEIIAGESAVAGLAALIGAKQSRHFSRMLDLNAGSKVLVIGTEGNTDPKWYESIINDVDQRDLRL